jgi:hypothetical protein
VRIPVVVVLLTITAALPAQTPKPVAPKAAAEATRRPLTTAAPTELPVTRVALYKNGVGFFEHSGHVTGSQSVTIDFTTDQLNDVLQSLTAIDLNGGRIAGAGYNSTTPLEQQLKALPLALDEDPTAVEFYNAIRGARVEVRSGSADITGRLLNIETVNTPGANGLPASEKRMITVISEAGDVHTLELTPTTNVKLLDADLHQDVTRYLQLLASTRSQGLRHLTLRDNGTGNRSLLVSYISEVPIWKSTYRILFTTPKTPPPTGIQTATLQGWSVVDNTTGSDWTNVQLSLIAGAPQSFIQPLSVPYYARRPEIPLPQEAQLTPQTHLSGDPNELSSELKAMAGPSSGPSGGQVYVDGFTGGQQPPRPRAAASAPAMIGRGAAGGVMGGIGMSPGNNASGRVINGLAIDALSDDGSSFQANAAASLIPSTTTAAFDDYFAYNLTEPITIRKNESAMVPILQTKIDAERVTLWSQQQPVPLRALWITNISELTLDRGSFSIVEDGNFGGEGLLDPIHPAEKRLLSYAVDQAVRVDNKSASIHHLRSLAIAKGVLTEHYRDIVTREYSIRNAASEPRTVVLEHARMNDYQLNSAGLVTAATPTAAENEQPANPVKPDETTPTLYRFRITVPAGQTLHFKVAESHAYPRTVQVGNVNDQQVKLLLQEMGEKPEDHPDFLKQIQPILDAQRKIADLNSIKRLHDSELTGLRGEEERQRANITALKDADKQAQQRFVNDLSHTEDQIAQKQKDQIQLDTQIQAAQKSLADLVQQIQFDQTLTD